MKVFGWPKYYGFPDGLFGPTSRSVHCAAGPCPSLLALLTGMQLCDIVLSVVLSGSPWGPGSCEDASFSSLVLPNIGHHKSARGAGTPRIRPRESRAFSLPESWVLSPRAAGSAHCDLRRNLKSLWIRESHFLLGSQPSLALSSWSLSQPLWSLLPLSPLSLV